MIVYSVPDAPRYFNGSLLRVVRPHQWLVRMASSTGHQTSYTFFRVGPTGLEEVPEPPTYLRVQEEHIPRHSDIALVHGNQPGRREIFYGLDDNTVIILRELSFQYLTLPVEKGARVVAMDIAPDGLTAIALAIKYIPLYVAVVLFDL